MAQPGLYSTATAVSTKAKNKGKNRKRKKSTMAERVQHIAHHERKWHSLGDGVSGGVVSKFRHGKEFGPLFGLV